MIRPSGVPGHCPKCNCELTVNPSVFVGRTTCADCENSLWFLQLSVVVVDWDQFQDSAKQVRYFDLKQSSQLLTGVIEVISEQFGINSSNVLDNELFKTDMLIEVFGDLELAIELEEALGIYL